MKAVHRLTEAQKSILITLDKAMPPDLSLDDVMALGALGLIDFTKSERFKLTKKGLKALEKVEAELKKSTLN
jgi:hypothetical protein